MSLYCGLAVARRMMVVVRWTEKLGHGRLGKNLTEHWRRSSPELQITWTGLAKLKQRNNILMHIFNLGILLLLV